MAVSVDKWNYKRLYWNYFGGIVAMRKEHFEKINGVSNRFWGWGGEDDDMLNRIKAQKLNVTRYNDSVARYRTIKHSPAKKNPLRFKLLQEKKR